MKGKFYQFTLLILLFLITVFTLQGQNSKNINELHQSVVWKSNSLKNNHLNEGLAGTYFGKYKQFFLLAGGSFFPDEKPWQGGKKQFSKTVFVFEPTSEGDFSVVYQGDDLPEALAEGAYVSLPEGLVCIGGQTPDGISAKAFLISYENGKIKTTHLPDLPFAVKSATATHIGKQIYLIGGQDIDGNSSNQFLKLDLNDLKKGWQKLPDYLKNVSGAMAVAQQDGEEISVFVFGGRSRNNAEITTFFSDMYQYKPSKNQWIAKKNIQNSAGKLPLAVATASKVGASSILLFGGDTGLIFNQVEKAINADNTSLRNELWQNHSGFEKEILVYNTITDEWFTLGNAENSVAVTSSFYDTESQSVYIAGGEQKPGIRSPFITKLSLSKGSGFGWLNYAVLGLYFVGMLGLGFFFMKNNNNTEDYFKGGGRIPWWAVGVSIFATMLSAITFISIPAKTYATDWRMLMFNMTIILAVPVIIRYFLPFFLRFKFDTAYQYLELRFSRSIRWAASAFFTLFMISRIAIVLFLPSLALNIVTGFNIYYAILIMSLVTIIYSTSGGMEAVVWGDVIQGFILVGGAIAAFVVMLLGIKGGFSEFWDTTLNFNKLQTFDFRFDFSQPVFWVVVFGGLANTLISYTSDQSVVQRYMSTVNEKATAKSIWLNGIVSVPVSILFFLLGTGLFAFYKSNPEQMSITDPNIDSIFPQFIVSQMPVGLSGLLIAAIFAAAMSTLSSNINSVSAVITSDFYKTFFKEASFKGQMTVARWSGIVVGLLGTAMAIVLATWNIASLWDQFNTFLGLLTSGLGALFILGIFFPRVGSAAAFIGLISGVVILYLVKSHTGLSFLLYGLIGMVSNIVIAILCSFVLPNQKEIKGTTWKNRNK
ncbi:sodium/solute symporter [Capnocytophaga sp.]|uniref:sodium:solute symporter family transporter n=1 Tax=Capnocytophaga sp. TaxID=44737 RepID=UPI0026DD6D2D|nr:sodium/solute symporter [Capnocytophaga sp.]MDO5106320.1 sodium/solute symporter [Capnocytophaga sp.]